MLTPEVDIIQRLRETAAWAQDGGTALSPLMEEAAAEIEQLQAALNGMQGVIAELAAEAKCCGMKTETLRLWSVGKLIGGPAFSVGVATPKTCAMIAAYCNWQREKH